MTSGALRHPRAHAGGSQAAALAAVLTGWGMDAQPVSEQLGVARPSDVPQHHDQGPRGPRIEELLPPPATTAGRPLLPNFGQDLPSTSE